MYFRAKFFGAQYWAANFFGETADAGGGGATDNLYRKAFGSMNRMMTP